MKIVDALLCSALLALALGSDKIKIDPSTRLYVSRTDGRVRVFHGLAAENNGYPWTLRLYDDQQIELFKSWGLNVVRLGFHWHLTEPSPGSYDMDYVNQIVEFITRLNKSEIHVILDMHQDCWSPLFCENHGVPSSYSHGYNSQYEPQGDKAYPLPILKPTYGPDNTLTDCANVSQKILGWSSCYLTYSIGAASQRLYDNDQGILDRFGEFWKLIARSVRHLPNVLGYELINEPWLGNAPLSLEELNPTHPHWNLWLPQEADKTNLAKFYSRLHQEIRTVDNDSIIFFEPATGGNFLDATPVGFSQGPGGPEYNDRQVLAYHVYCLWVDSKYNNSFFDKVFAWLLNGACNLVGDAMYDVRHSDSKKLGVAGFMTEFGDNGRGVTPSLINFATGKMDEFMHGWIFWYLQPDVDVRNSTEISLLARPYPHKIAGVPASYGYDPDDKIFHLNYTPCSELPCAGQPTEIFTAQNYAFSYGMAVTIATENTVEHSLDGQMLYVKVTGLVPGKQVSVTLTAK